MIALAPDVFYGLATKRITPRKARERAVLEGDDGVAAQVLDAISGAAAGSRPAGAVVLANPPDRSLGE